MNKLETLVSKARPIITNLFSGGAPSLRETTDAIRVLVQLAEVVIGAGNGDEKHALVRDAFYALDKEFDLIDKLDDAIKLPFFLEPFDGPFLRKTVDFLIVQAVTVLNATVWKPDSKVKSI